MKIIIETIPHDKQVYNTCGDYIRDADGVLHIFVSETGNDEFNTLVGFHEWIEVILMEKRGIPLETSTKFDIEFERDRGLKKYGEFDEPGDEPDSGYHLEHLFATGLEMALASAMGIHLKDYEKALNKL